MDEMTTEQREQFIRERVKSILDTREEFCKSMSEMSPSERDDYVHRRVERDLATEQAILQQQSTYVEFRQWTWPLILALDVVALLGLIGLAIRDWQDVIGVVCVAVAMLISRIISRTLTARAEKIRELLSKHANRLGNTAALDYYVDWAQNEAKPDG